MPGMRGQGTQGEDPLVRQAVSEAGVVVGGRPGDCPEKVT